MQTNFSFYMGTLRIILLLALSVSAFADMHAAADGKIPSSWKWVSDTEVIFSYDGTYSDSSAFVYNAAKGKTVYGVSAPEKYVEFPVSPEGAVNLTYSPDSTKLAFTRNNDLYVVDIATGEERRLTYDGSDLILNGYASWVYYEEIFGRQSRYRAFWWSPDSRKIGFYRFDNSQVPLFPIYSPFGQDGSLNETRYPKAGEKNPEVRIGMVDISSASSIVWADFDPSEDQYFGIPFWSTDSRDFYIARMPRLQNTLDLYRVSASDGSREHVYSEHCGTWLYWIDEVIFTERGMYMARDFETGWEQIYFLSYDGREFRRLTDGTNWRISLVRVDEKKGDVYFTAERDSRVSSALYRVDRKGRVTALTDPAYNVQGVSFSPSGKYFAASLSDITTPPFISVCDAASGKGRTVARTGYAVESHHTMPEIITMTTEDGFEIPAVIVYPDGFDPSLKYPVHMDIYGGPDSPVVRDRWMDPSRYEWWQENGIIQVWADCRASGHNGRAGLDMIYRQLTVWEIRDFVAWADYFRSLPYVDADRIGVEGFSFGGTMTAMLVMRHPEHFPYGIAGGGVYDWRLYDSHYTERYMDTPQNNPEGYSVSCALNYTGEYPVSYGDSPEADGPVHAADTVMLRLTHGTGDDNVHFQNTLQLIDGLQKTCRKFDFMIYPDGMHGYRGYQQEHFIAANREFWRRYLKGEL